MWQHIERPLDFAEELPLIQIDFGLVGCGVAAALITAVPIAFAIAIASSNYCCFKVCKTRRKKASYKAQFRIFKQLLTEARIMSMEKNVNEQ